MKWFTCVLYLNLHVRSEVIRETRVCYVNKARLLYLLRNNVKVRYCNFFDKMIRGKQDKLIQCVHK